MKRTNVERFYALLLWLHPPSFRRDCGQEILQHVRTAAAHESTRRLLALGVSDAIRSLAREWSASLSGPHHPPRFDGHRRGEHMQNIARDFRLAARVLLKSPTFTMAAVITLALGIGANTAIFTLADAALLRPVQVREPERLVVWSWTSSYPDFQEYTKRTDVFEGVAAVTGGSRMNVVIDGASEIARAAFISGQGFEVFGVGALHGRTIQPADDVANGPIVAVLGHDYWRTRFGGEPGVVGRTFRINARPVTIVGVLEKGFHGVTLSSNPAMYLPAGVYNQVQTGFFARVNALTARGLVWLTVIARLRSDVSPESAASAMTALYAQLHPPKPGHRTEPLRLETLPARALGRQAADVRTFVGLLVAVVGVTLLIGCANLANLLLARATVRRRELGVRVAMGATRGRVARLLLAESLLLAVAGGAAGIAVASAALRLLSSYELPGGIAIENMRLEISGTTLAVTAAVSILTGLVFGMLPAWRASRTDILVALRDQGRAATARSGVRGALLATQVALSLVLLAGAGLFGRSLLSALQAPLGFDPDGVLSASVNVGLARYDEVRARTFYAEALDRVRALDRVASAAWAGMIPTRGSWVSQTTIQGYSPAPGEDLTVNMSQVGPDYFKTIGARLLDGREFSSADAAGAPLVAVVNKAMSDKYWAGRRALGGKLGAFDQEVTVVGIVENAVTNELRGQPDPFVYLAFNQYLAGKESIALDPAHLFVRTRDGSVDILPAVRETLRALDPEMPLYDVAPLEQHVGALLMTQRMGLTLFSLFSLLALSLAAAGIYGVASYVASSRTREIGVRVALGATTRNVRRMVLQDGARPIAIGMLAGLGIALYAARLLKAFLLDVSPLDPITFAGATLVLASLALAASYMPARRAAQVDPIAALRDE